MLIQCGMLVSLAEKIRSLRRMNYFALFLSVLWTLPTVSSVGQDKSPGTTFNYPDRTITWKPWHESPQGEYCFRTGDRYLGHQTWEHYLGFAERRSSAKAIKLSLIHLANQDVPEDVVIRPGLRYAILKVTNGTMTMHKGEWSWTAQELD
jgi:hypothetical protein